jgi:molecular chaperone HscA
MTAGAARIRVTFAVDADGLLTVSATEDTTGIEAEVAVKPSYGIDEEEMAQMLYDSMKHAKDDMEVRLLAESRVEAGRNLNAVSAALSNDGHLLSAAEFNEIKAVVQQLEEATKGDDRDAITAASEQLEQATKAFAEKRMDRGIRSALRGVDVDALDEKAAKG